MVKNKYDPKCRVTWEMQGGLAGVGSLTLALLWLEINNVENKCNPKCRVAWEMQDGIGGVGSLRFAELWLEINYGEK